MAKKTQPEVFSSVPDYEVANFRKKLLEMYEETPTRAQRYADMIELVDQGVSPDTAAPACGIFDEWEEVEWLRDAVESAWARHKSRVMIQLGRHLTGRGDNPNASLATLFLKAHCGYNEKSAEGWHQNIKILPVVSASAGIQHSPDRNYWEFYEKRQEQAELEAEAAAARAKVADAESEPDETAPE